MDSNQIIFLIIILIVIYYIFRSNEGFAAVAGTEHVDCTQIDTSTSPNSCAMTPGCAFTSYIIPYINEDGLPLMKTQYGCVNQV